MAAQNSLIVELGYEQQLEEIEIGGSNSYWQTDSKKDIVIYTSLDKENWTEVGVIPSWFTPSVERIPLKSTKAKYVKFQHDCKLGISFLNNIRWNEEDE